MKRVTVLYFAILRDQTGIESEGIETNAQTFGDLYRDLAARHGFQLPESLVRPARNGEFCDMADPLLDGDEAAFLPPVAGG